MELGFLRATPTTGPPRAACATRSGSVLSLLRGGSAVWGREGLLDGMSGASDTIDALDRDQIALHDVHHPVLADSQPVIVTAVKSVRRVRAVGQPDDSRADSAHPVLICHVLAR